MSFLNLVEMSNKFEVPAFLFLALSTLIKKVKQFQLLKVAPGFLVAAWILED